MEPVLFGCRLLTQYYQQLPLLRYIIKWTYLGVTTGVLAGLGVTLFLQLLAWAIAGWTQVPYYYFLIPLVLFLNSLLVQWLAPGVSGGSDKMVEAIHQKAGYLPLAEVPVKIIATVMTITAGGSAGKEGPAAQLGATLASAWGRFLQVADADCRQIVICGISAGFAVVFGTPAAGAIFAVEVLFVGKILYETLYPACIAGAAGYYVAYFTGISYVHRDMIIESSCYLAIGAIVLGLFCGAVSVFFIKTIQQCGRHFDRLQLTKPVKALIGGIMLTFIAHFISPLYLGLSTELLENGVRGDSIPAAAFFWKTVATAVTLGCGGTGGIIMPVIVVGTAAGNLFGQLIGSADIQAYAVIGMAALLAGAVNTPIAAVIMAAELYGSDIIPYVAISCLISYIISGHRSIYPSQMIATGKCPAFLTDTGNTVRCAGKTQAGANKNPLQVSRD